MKKISILVISLLAFATSINAQNVLSSSYTTTNSSSTKIEEFTPYWALDFEIPGWCFVEEGWGMDMSIGANYHFNEKAFVGARIGWMSIHYDENNSEYVDNYSLKTELDIITIPIELGYMLYEGEKFKLAPFAGIGLNIGWDGESEESYWINRKHYENKYDLDIRGKVGVDGKIGIKCAYSVFGASCSYALPLNSKQEGYTGEDGYFKVSFCAGF